MSVNWLPRTMSDAVKTVRRWPKRTCHECGGRGTGTYRDWNSDDYDIRHKTENCHSCNGRGTIGGSQPGLHLWFQSVEERDAFKAKILRMRGIKWTDEAPASVLESQSTPKWKDD